MQKKRPFRSYLKILVFSSKCWFFWTYGQKQFFQRDLKKSNFSLNFDIFEDMEKKITFSKWFEMFILLDIWTKTNFSKGSKEKYLFFEFQIFSKIWTKTTFSKWSQNNLIFLEMLILLDIWTKNNFFKEI